MRMWLVHVEESDKRIAVVQTRCGVCNNERFIGIVSSGEVAQLLRCPLGKSLNVLFLIVENEKLEVGVFLILVLVSTADKVCPQLTPLIFCLFFFPLLQELIKVDV